MNFNIKLNLVLIWKWTKLIYVNKIEIKLNKNNKYKDQIEYKTLTRFTCEHLKKL